MYKQQGNRDDAQEINAFDDILLFIEIIKSNKDL